MKTKTFLGEVEVSTQVKRQSLGALLAIFLVSVILIVLFILMVLGFFTYWLFTRT